jgi:hypothetical protein
LTRNLPESTKNLVSVTVPLPSAIPTREQAISHILGFAQRAIASGDYERAREVFRDVLLLDPHHPTALRGLATLPPRVNPTQTARLLVPAEKLGKIPLSPAEALVVSRLAAGERPVWRLLEGLERPANEILETLDRLVARRIVGAADCHGALPLPLPLM